MALFLGPIALAAGLECPAGMLPVESVELSASDGRTVQVEAFCLDRTEVTVAGYRACVGRGDCTPAANEVFVGDIPARDRKLWSRSCNWNRPGKDRHPINCLTWRQATEFCEATGSRLPTDLEWGIAATGGAELRMYPWGRDSPTLHHTNVCGAECAPRLRKLDPRWPVFHVDDDGFAATAPVGSFPDGVGRWGHLDLAGNVWELTATTAVGDSSLAVIRGGGWAQTDRKMLESGRRSGYPVTYRGSAVGFRCAAEPLPRAPSGGTVVAAGPS